MASKFFFKETLKLCAEDFSNADRKIKSQKVMPSKGSVI
jgi:hypothetical protein